MKWSEIDIMRYMHQILKGQRKTIIVELERRIKLAKLSGKVILRKDNILKKEFYIEIDSEILTTEVSRILKLACKERNWQILGGLIEGNISSQPKPKPKSVSERAIVNSSNQDIAGKVITILSNHRSSIDKYKPLTLTKMQILSLLEYSFNPDYPLDKLIKQLETSLRELEAKGEIYAGVGNRFCIAHPTIFYENALFIGDRAYLPMAHQILSNSVSEDNKLVFADLSFEILQQKFLCSGISLITIEQSFQYLSEPSLPLSVVLRGHEVQDPFLNPDYINIFHYTPQWGEQINRWQQLSPDNLRNPDLLKIPTGEYLWHDQGEFYQLEKDSAILTMFKLDKEFGQPLKVVWDKDSGHLDLNNVNLPSNYAQYIWRISSPTEVNNRVRYVEPNWRRQLENILKKLGCQIV
ncbi:hypothetical protein IQ225_18195 [Synechocystis salina LEGE 06155]|nr:hypothetical protein [Synechocystis salina LEGE 06155]